MCSKSEAKLNGADVVTPQDVAIVAQRVTNDPYIKILDYHITAYSAEKLGFLGSHQQLKITVEKRNTRESEILHLFVKSIPCDCKDQTEFINSEGIFVKESSIFETVIPRLTESYKGEKWSPTCYLAKKNRMIMEDLRFQGYKLLSKFFDESEALKSVLAALARFHACSIIAEAKVNRILKKTTTLIEYYPDSFNEVIFNQSGKGSQWCSAGVNLAAMIAERLGHSSWKVRQVFECIYDIIRPSTIHCNVFCHGDLWMNNIMFADAKPLAKCVLVDYQVARYAPLALDLLQLLYLNTTRSFREKFEKDLIDFYYTVLKNTIQNNDPTNCVKVPTLKEILYGYEDLRLFGPMIACLYFPIALLDPKIAAEHTKDSESYNKFIFKDRNEVTFSYMEKNEFYRKMIEEAVIQVTEFAKHLCT